MGGIDTKSWVTCIELYINRKRSAVPHEYQYFIVRQSKRISVESLKTFHIGGEYSLECLSPNEKSWDRVSQPSGVWGLLRKRIS